MMLLIFDLDDTLIDTTGTITPFKLNLALKQMIENGLEITDFDHAVSQLERINEMSISGKHALQEFLELNESGEEFLEIGSKVLYEEELGSYPVFPVDGALELLDHLRDHTNHTMVIVSKGEERMQREKLARAGISEKYFSKIIVCSAPQKREHYHKLMTEYDVSPKDVVVCGDRIQYDLTPAKELGMNTIQIRWGRGNNETGSQTDVDYDIISLRQYMEKLKDLLKKSG